MTAGTSTRRHGSTAKSVTDQGLLGANRLVDAIKRRWQEGEPPDVTGVLAGHPELQQYRSVVLDLAYTEYRLRLQTGETIDAETFARQFPSLQRSLYLLIEVHGLLSQDPELRLLQESMSWPEAGSCFLQFNLVAEIGRGAFGRVFLATEPAIGNRQIVVKITPHGGGEAGILGKLQHPNIVPVYSLQEDEVAGVAAFCMPYLGRATLCDVLDRSFLDGRIPLKAQVILEALAATHDDLAPEEPLPPPSILRRGSYVDGVIHLAAQLADALVHAHGRGICHRDLKPSNVLMTSLGRPLLLDFNLSVDSRLPAWRVGGTLPYMPPEELARLAAIQADPGPLRYDPRSDLFSLGVIIYELLTGKLPFGAMPREEALKTMACQLRERQANGPEPIRELNGHVDRRLARLVESCLAFQPDCRPETAQQLAGLLRRELSPARRSRRWAANHRGFVLAIGSMLLTLTIAATAFFALRPPYDVRQLQLGLRLLDQGEYSLAVDSLGNSIRANPKSGEAWFARGRAYHRSGNFEAAYHDYDAASLLTPQPILSVCKGYCLGQINSHRAAISLYDSALKARYDRPLLLYNNIGVGYLAMRQLDDAERSLRHALRLDPNLGTAHYGMMQLLLRRALHSQSVSQAAFVHASRAIEIGPPTADLYRVVAALYAVAARQDPKLIQSAVEYVKKSVELGSDPQAFISDSSYSALWQEPSFHDALRKAPSASGPVKAVQLLDPLDTL